MTQESTTSTTAARERTLIGLLCLLAAIHVFFFSAAFPLFNNVDEPIHFDLIVKYTESGIPRGLQPLSDESLNYIVLFSTSAFYQNPTNLPNGQFPPPPWTQPMEKVRPTLLAEKKMGSQILNYEDMQPPLYYTLTSLWWRLGKVCGMHDGFLPFWIRFLNIALVAALVWLAYVAAKIVFLENFFMRIGVPSVLAFMPQTAFYSISNDILSPVCFGAAFICLLYFWRAEIPQVPLGIFTGLALAATFLAKTTNLPELGMALGFVLFKAWRLAKDGKLKPFLPSLIALLVCAGLPMAAWMAWCKNLYGDFTGASANASAFGWTVKPFAQWWHHPIFSPSGVWTYVSGELGTLWQGEFRWHSELLVLPGTNLIYIMLTILFLAMSLSAMLQRSSSLTPGQRPALWLSLACFAAALGFFALMSTVYDFHNAPNPTRQHPFFYQGRLLLGSLIPFLLLFVYGLDRVLNRFGNAAKFIMLGAMISAMLAVEIATDWPVYSNPFNWFHLP